MRSFIDDQDNAKFFAEQYVAGLSTKELAQEFSVSDRTIRVWVKDPRVQAHARTFAQERAARISRKIDGAIEARLAGIEDWDTELILKVRKEYLERPLKIADGEISDTSGATNEIADAMDNDPEFAEKLVELFNKG